MQALLWNEEAGAWLDYDIINQKQRSYFTPTNLSPLMFGCYNTDNKSEIARKVLAYIESAGIDAFPGGVPATLIQTGEQWDYPNAWAPQQHWLTEGLRKLDDKNATDLANKWTKRWTLSNFIAYKETKAMYEKVIHTLLSATNPCIHSNLCHFSDFVVFGRHSGRPRGRRRIRCANRIWLVKRRSY